MAASRNDIGGVAIAPSGKYAMPDSTSSFDNLASSTTSAKSFSSKILEESGTARDDAYLGGEPLNTITRTRIEQCRFPTASKSLGISPTGHSIVPVIHLKDLLARGLTAENLLETLKVAWAVLLRSYVRTNRVTYGFIDDASAGSDVIKIVTCTFTALATQGNKSYCLVDSIATWDDIEDKQINTAIQILVKATSLARSSSADYGKGHYQLTLVADLFDQDSVISIVVLLPAIPPSYGHAVANAFREILLTIASAGLLEPIKEFSVGADDTKAIGSWNSGPLLAPIACLHHLVEEAVRSTPDKPAIEAWDGSMTYSQLDARSINLAQKLHSYGVRPGTFVPIAFEKSCWTTVAMLGVLKAGGAFVPLDPTHPESRLQGLLADLGVSILLTSSMYEDKLKTLVEHTIVVTAATTISAQKRPATEAHQSVSRSNDPVFILFTSGSTGRPKGIVHEHGAMVAHALALGQAVGYRDVRTLQFSAYTWDIAVIDTFTTLAFKGCVCIPSEEGRKFDITCAINTMKAELAILTPSFASLMNPGAVPTIHTLILCGEALKQDTVRRWADRVRLFQAYGPAEVGICTLMKFEADVTHAETVGPPLNSRCFLVDPENYQQLVPIGATGELVVAGPSIAREYLNDQEKTLSSFISDPQWASNPNPALRRFYKTGDLLNYDLSAFDGTLDFIGRKDNQIKRHGQRVDPGEVEHHIANIANVAMSMLAVPKEGCYRDDLVAVATLSANETTRSHIAPLTVVNSEVLSFDAMIDYLSRVLPRYMLPTALVTVSSMPLSTSMKLERRKVNDWLAAMTTRPTQGLSMSHTRDLLILAPEEYTAYAISRHIADSLACKDLEHRQRLAGHDFGLQKAGLNSIQLISLSIFLQKTYNVKVPMAMILSSKVTIRDLAALVESNTNNVHPIQDEPGKVDVLREAKRMASNLIYDLELRLQSNPYEIFLTGCTGFLGSEVLRQLLQLPGIKVYNLVRARSEQEALKRIIDRATSDGWWDPIYLPRLEAWKGDMACPNLGLSPQHLRLFGTEKDIESDTETPQIDAIIHLGANLNHTLDLSTVSPTNVTSTLDLLRLTALSNTATKISPKRDRHGIQSFTYISGGLQITPGPDSDALLSARAGPASGYEQSKLLAELVVKQCALHPRFNSRTAIRIVKMGFIVGDESGRLRPSAEDFIWRVVRASVGIGGWSEEGGGKWIFIAGVGDVARGIVGTIMPACDAAEMGKGKVNEAVVNKVLCGMPLAQFWDTIRTECGYVLRPMEQERWLGLIKAAVDLEKETHPLFPVMHLLERNASEILGSEVGDGSGNGSEVGDVGWGKDRDCGEKERIRRVVATNVRALIKMGLLPRNEKQQRRFEDLKDERE